MAFCDWPICLVGGMAIRLGLFSLGDTNLWAGVVSGIEFLG